MNTFKGWPILFCAVMLIASAAGFGWAVWVPLKPAQLTETSGPYLAAPSWDVPVGWRANNRTLVPDPTANYRALAPGSPSPLLYARFDPWRRAESNCRPEAYEAPELPLLHAAVDFVAQQNSPRNALTALSESLNHTAAGRT